MQWVQSKRKAMQDIRSLSVRILKTVIVEKSEEDLYAISFEYEYILSGSF